MFIWFITALDIFVFYKCFSFAEMMKKFNQEMYAKMKAKKNEPHLSLKKKMVRVVEKGTLITPATSIPKATRMTSSLRWRSSLLV